MKKEYMTPTMRVVELQHKTCLLQASGTKYISTSGLDAADDLNISDEGGGSSIWDR